VKKFLSLIAVSMALAAPLAHAADAPAADGAKKPVASAAASTTADPRYTYKTPRLNRAQIDALLAKPGKVLVIDVRRPDELTKIGGFPVYLSIQNSELENSLAYIPKDRAILTVSNRAHRAGAAGDILSSHGFKVAGAAGVNDYADQGGTLTKIAPPAPKPEEAPKP
jgi:rhodanese-related sulfurtransferase